MRDGRQKWVLSIRLVCQFVYILRDMYYDRGAIREGEL